MNEEIINALMQLFAILSFIKSENSSDADNIVKNFLTERLNSELVLKYYKKYKDFQNALFKDLKTKKREKKISALGVKILLISRKINLTLNNKEKYLILLRTIEYITTNTKKIPPQAKELLLTINTTLNLDHNEFEDILNFAIEKYEKISPEKLLLIKGINTTSSFEYIPKRKENPNLDKEIIFLFIKEIQTFIFRYYGNLPIRLNVKIIKPGNLYHFDSGAIIRANALNAIYQSELLKNFIKTKEKYNITLVADKIEFKYPKSENGIKKVSFAFNSGELIGIIGSSGVGKSTFLNLIAGKLKPQKGKLYLNGIDIHKNQSKIKGLIGFVPQEDTLIENFTVYQNLFYTAKLSFGNYSSQKIHQIVINTLKKLNIYDIKDQKVGSPLNRYISGGQRKRLNIAIELIREPAILFIDEPTSGLSSTDATMLMHQLKAISLDNKLIITNIHQPSSEIFKLFTKIIIIDKQGYIVYIGNPIEAIWYFKSLSYRADADYVQCPTCGNIRTDEILEIIEEKIISEDGKPTEQRKTSPLEWYLLYKFNLEKRSKIKVINKPLPKNLFKPPSRIKQFFIFLKRNLHAKISDIQYTIIALTEAPILAVILALLSKKITNGKYIFALNDNIPAFLFMAIVVAMFIGLSISAEEIFKDKKILEREQFLKLSKLSYLFSKLISLMIFSAIEMFLFIIISNAILEIRGLLWEYWFILFSTAVLSNIIGLNISASFKSIVSIYITIPLILVPQMLLGGAMIKFDNMHPYFKSPKFTPIIADLTIARWSYEALAVEQFTSNKYEKNFFPIDKKKAQAIFITGFWCPEMQKIADKAIKAKQNNNLNLFHKNITIIKNELKRFYKINFIQNIDFQELNRLNFHNFTNNDLKTLSKFLSQVKKYYKIAVNQLIDMKDKKIDSIIAIIGKQNFIKLKENYQNNKLIDIILNSDEPNFFIIAKGNIIAKKNPIFIEPYSNIGRAHFYASEKIIGKLHIPTFTFNNTILWIYSLIMFIILYFDGVKKFFTLFNLKKQ